MRAHAGAARRSGSLPAARAGRPGAGSGFASRPASSSSPSSGRGEITTPSCSRVVESAGMPPGVGPPTSAWWARLAAKPSSCGDRRRRPASPSSRSKTGRIRVMSGRWVPPANGSLRIQPWPGRLLAAEDRGDRVGHRAEVDGDVLGLHHELALGSNSAVEQSRRSLMFGEWAERIRTAPISSQAARRAPARTWSETASTSHPPSAFRARLAASRLGESSPLGDDAAVFVDLARSSRAAASGSIRATRTGTGPRRSSPSARARRCRTSASTHSPPTRSVRLRALDAAAAGDARGRGCGPGTRSATRIVASSISPSGSR